MTEAEWLASDNAPQMIAALWELHHGESTVLQRRLHRYYLTSCRAIVRLLPQVESRRGIELGERYLAGELSDQELSKANYEVEGAAFNIDYDCDPEAIAGWVEQIRAIPPEELGAMLHPPESASRIEVRELLKRAAYFADYAMVYQGITPKGPPPANYGIFLSANLLRQVIGDPFHPSWADPA